MSDARQLPDYYCVKCEQRRTQGCFRRSCPGIPAHYVISDLERDLAADHAEAATLRAELAENEGVISVWRRRAVAAEEQGDALRAEVERLRAGIDAVASLINESRGVYGLHQNGDPSPWDELREGGVFEEWLIAFDHALAATEVTR